MSWLTFWLIDSVDSMQRKKDSAVKPLLIILGFLLLMLLFSSFSNGQDRVPCCSSDVCRLQHHHGLPEAPRPKPDSKVFWLGTAALAASQTADAITTRQLLNRGGVELDPIFGRNPSPAKQAGINAALFAGQVLAFRLTEKSPHRWIRLVGRAAIGWQIGSRTYDAACNSGLNPHSSQRCGAY